MKKSLLTLFLFLSSIHIAHAQYVRTLCSTLTLGSTVQATCFDYTSFTTKYWSGSAWVAATVGAPTDATYITKTANGTLSAEQALGALATGLLKSTTTTGTVSIGAAGTDFVGPGAITSSGLTQATGKLLGRSTASTGAVEEITVGTNLTLSGGTLTASGGASGYATVQDEGSGLTQRATINFTGSGVSCVDNGGSTRTDCTISGGGSGGLTLVESQILTGAATSITFSGLDGNTDRMYRLIGMVGIAQNTSTLSITVNGAATNLSLQRVYTNGFDSKSSWELLGPIASGSWLAVDFTFAVKANPNSQSFNRGGVGNLMYSSGTTATLVIMYGLSYNDTSTNITSLALVDDQSNGLANGSYLSLYKYAQ